jgi:hypothetical protein
MARECLINIDTDGGGCKNGEWCAPAPAEGFELCIFFKGEDPAQTCPDAYPERHVIFKGFGEDSRACAPCKCGEPAGASCSALVSVFTDGACGDLLGSWPLITAMDQGCWDLAPGIALGSKEAIFTIDKPGTCMSSGGEPIGDVKPAGAVTLCCQPEKKVTP